MKTPRGNDDIPVEYIRKLFGISWTVGKGHGFRILTRCKPDVRNALEDWCKNQRVSDNGYAVYCLLAKFLLSNGGDCDELHSYLERDDIGEKLLAL